MAILLCLVMVLSIKASDMRISKDVKKHNLRVFYGWVKVGKIRKREAISVIFENDRMPEEKQMRSISKYQNTVFVRNQTDDEKLDAEHSNRVFTEYSIFLDDKAINGSLQKALKANNDADRNNVPTTVRKKIEDALRLAFMASHPRYKEPQFQQLSLFDFEEQ